MSRMGISLVSTLALVVVASVLPRAFGQVDVTASRTVYLGTVLNTTVPPSNAGPTPARESVILDLTLFDDGFAYGRLILPRRGVVIAGGGSLRNDSDLRLVFRPEAPGMYAGWAASFAHEPTDGATVPQPGVVASFSGYRDFAFGEEGTLITGALAFSSDPTRVLNLELHRRAEYATWELAQGRIRSSFTSPYWLDADSQVSEFLETGGRTRIDDFVREGRRFGADGMLGWGWEMHEYVTLEGAARSYLSLLNHAYVYTGGAHPNTFFGSYLLEVRPSGVSVLGIQDLFRADSTWLRRLTPLVLQDLARQGAQWVTQGDVTELTVNDLAAFTLSADGLTFYFSPYAMGPYVQGPFEVTLPFEALLGLAPAGGPLEAFGTATPPR
ncbi:MAG TPA: DUF3298 domain-containing protein [Trueperaceae bacterium]|nr:DUF3298 domain-containing protein [Trueperaceae bacterium]